MVGSSVVRSGGETMLRMQSDAGYQHVAPTARAPGPSSTGAWMRQWFHVWRWPAGVVAGLVLWLALVAVVGAAPRFGNTLLRGPDCPWACRVEAKAYNADVINHAPENANVMTTSCTKFLRKRGIDCRSGSSPRP